MIDTEMLEKVMKDFEKVGDVSEDLIKKYKKKLPKDIIYIWENYGFGSFCNGFLKVIDPELYIKFVSETFFIKNTIPIMVTGTGELIAWVDRKYIYMLDYKENDFENLACGFDFFWEDLVDNSIKMLKKKIKQYQIMINNQSSLPYNQCFVMEKKLNEKTMNFDVYMKELVKLYGNI